MVAQGMTTDMNVRALRIQMPVHPGVRLAQIVPRGIGVGTEILCMILCTDAIRRFHIRVRMDLGHAIVIILVVLEPARYIMATVMQDVILIHLHRVKRGIIILLGQIVPM